MRWPWQKKKRIKVNISRIDTKFQTSESYTLYLDETKNGQLVVSVQNVEGRGNGISLMVTAEKTAL